MGRLPWLWVYLLEAWGPVEAEFCIYKLRRGCVLSDCQGKLVLPRLSAASLPSTVLLKGGL